MKIVIKSSDMKLIILLPTALVLNRLTVSIAAKIIRSREPSIPVSSNDLKRLIDEIKRYKRIHKNWEVVNIHTASGEKILVRL